MQDLIQDCFSSLTAWEENVSVSKRFLWINVFGVPFQHWNIEFFKEIGKECREFISLAEATFTMSRMDVAIMLISSSLYPIPHSLDFLINGKVINLRNCGKCY